MEKYFVCMAVSYKYGGRCIGGVELTKNNSGNYTIVSENGTPKWVRPVTKGTEHGEIPNTVSQRCNVLDIIKLYDVEACGECAQSENYYFSKIEKVGRVSKKENVLDMLCDKRHSLLFGNRGKAVHPDYFEGLEYSLMLVKTDDVTFFMEKRYGTDRERLRARFNYNGVEYDLPVTDPELCERADENGANDLNGSENYYMTVSLGVEYEGWHSKLIANVICMD